MKKRLVFATIALLTASLVGIIAFQGYWISMALSLKQEEFDRSAREAVLSASRKASRLHTAQVIGNHLIINDSALYGEKRKLNHVYKTRRKPQKKQGSSTKTQTQPPHLEIPAPQDRGGVIAQESPRAQIRLVGNAPSPEMIQLWQDSLRRLAQALETTPLVWPISPDSNVLTVVSGEEHMSLTQVYSDSLRVNGHQTQVRTVVKVHRSHTVPGTEGRTLRFFTTRMEPEPKPAPTLPQVSLEEMAEMTEPAQNEKVKKLVNSVVDQMVLEFKVEKQQPAKTLSPHVLDSLLRLEFRTRGLELPFEYTVLNAEGKPDSGKAPLSFDPYSPQATLYKAALFPEDIFNKGLQLAVYFPGRTSYAWKSLSGMLTASLVFTLLMIGVFWLTIRTLLRQKKISEMKSDFINNMTHELKTPLATIGLAVDSIQNAEVRGNEDSFRFFTGMIREENRRMNQHVEQVLQLAQMERGQYSFHLQATDLLPVLDQAAEKARMAIEAQGGVFRYQKPDSLPSLWADAHHLAGALDNLLDNALKYAGDQAPDVVLEVKTSGPSLEIAVSDRGLGIKKEDQLRIFDTFYRVGNATVHNVKGFGIGLSYVKRVMEAHKGHVQVESSPGLGSRFSLYLPWQNPDAETF